TGWLITFRCLRARTEEELLHLAFKKLSCLGLDGCQSVLVNQHSLMFEPAGPSLFRDIIEDPLSQRARIGLAIQCLGFLFEYDALNGAGHDCHPGAMTRWRSNRTWLGWKGFPAGI